VLITRKEEINMLHIKEKIANAKEMVHDYQNLIETKILNLENKIKKIGIFLGGALIAMMIELGIIIVILAFA